MTWVSRLFDELTGDVWARCMSPRPDGRCPFGEPWIGIHAHRLTDDEDIVVKRYPRSA